MNMLYATAAGLGAAVGMLVFPADVGHASPPAPMLNRTLIASCANCHGTYGRSVGDIPPIAGQSREVLVRKLHRFRTGAPDATLMHQLAKAYTEGEIEMLAQHFSGQAPEGAVP